MIYVISQLQCVQLSLHAGVHFRNPAINDVPTALEKGCHIKDFELIKSLQTLDKHAHVDGVGERDGHAGFGGLFPRGWMR